MDRFFYLFLAIFLLLSNSGTAQRLPVYNHFYLTPYWYNPAEVASDEFTSVVLNHRQQWRGVEGSPMVSTLTFQMPFDYKRLALGANLRAFERGLITTYDFNATFAYTSYLTKVTKFKYGLSVGATSNTIDLEAIDDPNDPVLVDFLNNNVQPTANFGMKLSTKNGLNLGVSLPKLFAVKHLNEGSLRALEFSPFDEIFFMGYFKRKIAKKIVRRRRNGVKTRIAKKDFYAPLQLYMTYRYSQIVNNQIELSARMDLSENLYAGAGYRLNYGITGFLGLNINQFSFAYAYEPAGNVVTGFANGSHEVQLSLRIGEKKKLQRSAPILKTVHREEKHEARFTHGDIDPGRDETPVKEKQSNKTFYVVLKTFNNFNGADDLVRRLKEQDIETDIFYNKSNRKFYVYIFKTKKMKEANQEKKAVQDLTKFKKVSIIVIDD